jgi:colicin import membrane protein
MAEGKVRARAEAERKAAEEKREAGAEAKRKAVEEARRKAEADRQAAEERRAQKAQWAREAEAVDAPAAENARREAFRFGALIGDRVEQQSVRPPGIPSGLECTLAMHLEPTGDVIDGSVRVESSSGSAAFDGSVIAAVYKASPLPVPTGQSFELLRHFRFEFRP